MRAGTESCLPLICGAHLPRRCAPAARPARGPGRRSPRIWARWSWSSIAAAGGANSPTSRRSSVLRAVGGDAGGDEPRRRGPGERPADVGDVLGQRRSNRSWGSSSGPRPGGQSTSSGRDNVRYAPGDRMPPRAAVTSRASSTASVPMTSAAHTIRSVHQSSRSAASRFSAAASSRSIDAMAMRMSAARRVCPAAPPWARHTRPPVIAHPAHGCPFVRRAAQRRRHLVRAITPPPPGAVP